MICIKKILVIAAHPDDEVFGCGATIAKHTKAAADVFLLVFGDGVTARIFQSGVSREKELKTASATIERRQRELHRAAGILGIKPERIKYCGYPDQRFDAVPILDIIKEIEAIKSDFAPEIVYTHHWGDLNRDHRVVYEATVTAFRPKYGSKTSAEILCYEIPGNMDILQPLSANRFKPDVLVDAGDTFDIKMEAVKAYASELNAAGPLSVEGLIAQGKKRAGKTKYKMVEAFVGCAATKGGIYGKTF
ncbi:PIG-L family deacetylase [Candidatus Saganbacteria bacterium]|nr:PIG-L family deacetylase [Candidatus Saganbacteria bacterium]